MSLLVQLVDFESELYEQTLSLRLEILREPIGLTFSSEDLATDRISLHVAAMDEDKLVGCLVLVPMDESTIKMRQVAVSSDRQRAGVGTAMVAFSEREAKFRGFDRIVLHARREAVPFYERLGYLSVGEEFIEVGVPHREMLKFLY